MVVSCSSTSSFSLSYIMELTTSVGRVVISSVGHMTFRSRTFLELDSMRATGLASPPLSKPTRYFAISSMGAMVAERPMRVKSVSQ